MSLLQKALRDSRNPSEQRRLHTLRGELRRHEQLASQVHPFPSPTRSDLIVLQLVLQSANVVCCTLTTASRREVFNTRFDVVVIDECAQVGESPSSSMMALLKCISHFLYDQLL
jgi:hypothetical protein